MTLSKYLAFGALILSGCTYLPLRPGISRIDDSGAYVRQSQNPKTETTQKFSRITEVVPPGSLIVHGRTNQTAGQILRTEEHGETTIGAAQKDTARDIAAKLGSLKSVVWVGILVFLFGAASFVYPPLKLLVGGSVTTSAVISGAGVALIVLPSLLVGHEVLILGVAAGAAGLYWFAHRHGSLQGTVDALKADAKKVISVVENAAAPKPAAPAPVEPPKA